MKPTDSGRRKVSAAQLHDLLAAEFRKTAGDQCLRCRVPMPAYFAGSTGVNWRVGALDECSSLCHSILQDLVEKLSQHYELRGPQKAV
jgi:hypothetical protein